MDLLKEKQLAKKGEYLILTEGTIKKKTGGTDSMRIISVE
jgi:pyruvate kinase